LHLAGRKLNAAAVIGNNAHCFGRALIDSKELVIAQIEPETDELIGHIR